MREAGRDNGLAARLERAVAARRRIVLCALGSHQAGDDGTGPALLERCRRLRPGGGRELFLLDAGTRLELHLGRIQAWRPGAVIFLDAVAGGKPGRLWLFDLATQEPGLSLSTHGMPLSAVAAFFREGFGADCFLLGIGGESFRPGERLSAEARRGIARAFGVLSRALGSVAPGRKAARGRENV